MGISWNKGNEMHHAREILDMPVYSIIEGKSLGSIAALYIRDADHSVTIVRVGKPHSNWHGFLPFSTFRKIGPKVALIDTESALHDGAATNELSGLEIDLAGCPVITQSGKNVGHLAGISVEESTGKIDHLRVETDAKHTANQILAGNKRLAVPDAMIVSLKNGAVHVRDEIEHWLEK